MIHPYDLIGLPYRLGACPERHHAADCLTLARAVLAWQGIDSPEGKRSWYRRLKQGDITIFEEELSKWGNVIESPTLGTVALCRSELGLGMASYFDLGWIHFGGSVVRWSPLDGLQVVGCYCPMKSISVNHSA